MTKARAIAPILHRSELLHPDLHADVCSFLNEAHQHDIMCLSVRFISKEGHILPLAGVEFVNAAVEFVNAVEVRYASELTLPGDLHGKARDLSLSLMEGSIVADQLDEIAPQIFEEGKVYVLSFFERCAILHHERPRSLSLEGCADALSDRAHQLERARLCTLILSQSTSNHSRASEPPKVLEALDYWKTHMVGTSWSLTLPLAYPDQVDIMRCDGPHPVFEM